MKKILILVIFIIGFTTTASAQNVVIQQNSSAAQSQVQHNNEYYINGISTSKDIGGVDVEFIYTYSGSEYYLKFTNYNSSAVTVLFEVKDSDGKKTTGTIILKGYETKQTPNQYEVSHNKYIAMIVRKLQ